MSKKKQEKTELTLKTPITDLQTMLIDECDPDNRQEIVDIFNINLRKKDVIRASKLSDLEDKISDEMTLRLEKNSGAFNNKDLIDYLKVIHDTRTKSETTLENLSIPNIQINQQNINISGEPELTRESKNRVIEAIQSILSKQSIQNENTLDDTITVEEVENGNTTTLQEIN